MTWNGKAKCQRTCWGRGLWKISLPSEPTFTMKSDAFGAYKDFEAWCSIHLDATVNVLHSDHGDKHLDKEFIAYLNLWGMEQKFTVHDTPLQNSVPKHHNWTIVEQIHILLHASGLQRTLWGEVACHVIWLLNCMSMKAVSGKIPFKAAFGRKLNLHHVFMRKFGFVW